MFSKHPTSGRTCHKGPLCAARKWAGNKTVPDPAELGTAGAAEWVRKVDGSGRGSGHWEDVCDSEVSKRCAGEE